MLDRTWSKGSGNRGTQPAHLMITPASIYQSRGIVDEVMLFSRSSQDTDIRTSSTSTTMLSVPPHVGPSLAPSPVVPWHPLLPLSPPPATAARAPPAPSRPPVSPPPGFVRSIHASPGAWPRSFAESRGNLDRYSHPYTDGPPAEDKAARAAQLKKAKGVCGEMPKKAHEWEAAQALADPQPPHPLWLAVERWRREVPVEGGVTLLCMHANGMAKEDYHPALRRLLADSGSPVAFGTGAPLPKAKEVVVNEVFLLEDTLHGASVDLNAGHLPPVHAWADLARDILNFVVHVLPHMSDDAPWQLYWHAEDQRKASAPSRTIIGIGHSLGGNALVHASFTRPETFAALALIDPMVSPLLSFQPCSQEAQKEMLPQRRECYPTTT